MGNLLDFAPIAQRLATRPAHVRMDELLSSRDPAESVRALDAFGLYNLIQDVGVGEALELVHLASAEQSQAFLDFSCWSRDALDFDRLGEWLEILFQSDDSKMDALQREMDPELVGLFFRKHIQVFFYNDEDDATLLESLDVPIESSPDGVYAIVMPTDPELAGRVRLALHRLYFADHNYARRLLHAARYEMDGPLLDTAYRVRSGRLQQYGFMPAEEAAAIYAPADVARERKSAQALLDDSERAPLSLSVRAPFELPPSVAHELTQVASPNGSFFGRALLEACEAGGETIADTLMCQIATLVNTSVMADLGEPGDTDALGACFRRTHGYMNLGLEYLCERRTAAGALLISSWPLKRLHRVGYSLTAQLAGQAQRLINRGNLSLVDELPFSLCSPAESDLLEGLHARRPVRSKTYERGFERLKELESAAAVIALLAYKELWTFGLWNHRRDTLAGLLFEALGSVTPVEDITFDALLATHAVVGLSDPPGHFDLLTHEQLANVIQDHISKEHVSDELTASLQLAVSPSTGSNVVTARQLAARWTNCIVRRLTDEYGHVHAAAAERPEFLPNLLLVRRPLEGAT